MQVGVGLLDTDMMPIFMFIALDIIITLRFSINCSAKICSSTVIFSILREASSETYGPGVYFPSHLVYYFSIFTFQSIQQNTKNIYFIIFIRSHFASGREGIDNPFIALVARFLFVCVGTRRLACSLLLD